MPTLGGILYLALNFSITSLESTRRFELTHFLRSFKEKLTSSKRKLWGFKETYRFEKKVLEQVFSICRRTRRWKRVTDSMYELYGCVIVESRKKNWFEKLFVVVQKLQAGKLLLVYPRESSIVKFTSCSWTWGTQEPPKFNNGTLWTPKRQEHALSRSKDIWAFG